MGICSYFSYLILLGIIHQNLATIISIIIAIIIYVLSLLALKVFSKQEIQLMPKGEQIYRILKKLKIY